MKINNLVVLLFAITLSPNLAAETETSSECFDRLTGWFEAVDGYASDNEMRITNLQCERGGGGVAMRATWGCDADPEDMSRLALSVGKNKGQGICGNSGVTTKVPSACVDADERQDFFNGLTEFPAGQTDLGKGKVTKEAKQDLMTYCQELLSAP